MTIQTARMKMGIAERTRLVDQLAARANGSFWERLTVWPIRLFRRGEIPKDSLAKLNDHLFWVSVELRVTGVRKQARLAPKRLNTLAGAFATFTIPGTASWRATRRPAKSLLSAGELAALWHPPVSAKPTEGMGTAELPYPNGPSTPGLLSPLTMPR